MSRPAPASLDELDRRIINALQGGFPIVMGGDHSLALGSAAGSTRRPVRR